MSKKVKIIGCVAVLVTGLTGSAQDLNENDIISSDKVSANGRLGGEKRELEQVS